MASARIQRWALTLSAYSYSIRYKPGRSLANADTFSRLPRPVTAVGDKLPGELVHLLNHISTTCLSSAAIKNWTSNDPVLLMVRRYLMTGWPADLTKEEFKPYKQRERELSILDGCVLWGSRVVVPPPGRKSVLQELHETHPGISKMKSLARNYVWWPRMDAEIEEVVKKCNACQETRHAPPAAPIHPWEWPSQPWSRLHMDFAGPWRGHQFLVIVDSHSKWLDAHILSSISSAKTIEKLREVFATHGFPRKIVTDNGTAFTSREFQEFMRENGIVHVTSAPYHPATNGLAERGVQTLKQGIKKTPGQSMQEKLIKFLFKYRLTPHTTTGVAPSELLLGRKVRSRLDRTCQRKSEAARKSRKITTIMDDHFDSSKSMTLCMLRTFQSHVRYPSGWWAKWSS